MRPVQPVVAVLSKRGRFVVAEPLFEKGERISLAGKAIGEGRPGDIVLVGTGKRGARVFRRVGRPNVARDVLEALMLHHGLRRSFPRAVDEEAAEAAKSVPQSDQSPRRDLRDLATFTIDPVTARDFDDAISAEREGERARIWVHIADVSAFVEDEAVIELEAFRRGTSVYVPGAVEPMLPQALSNDACSLRPGEDRLAVTVEIEMAGTEPVSVAYYRSLIRSDARLTYEQVDEIFAGKQKAKAPWKSPLTVAREVAHALNEERLDRGGLEVESSEPSFEFDDRGNVVAVHHDEQTESHRLIEHLMILANEQVATYLHKNKIPTLYRVHERPDPRSVEALAAKLAALDIPTPAVPENMSSQQAADMVGEISRSVVAYVRKTGRGKSVFPSLVLRALKKAIYSPENLGHAGLASDCYCHFTSPIRRYPDLVVHRGLLAGVGAGEDPPRASEMDEAAVAASAAERRAMMVERDAQDVCFAFLLEHVLSEDHDRVFDGEIVGLIGAGAFVRFGDEGFEGLLPRRRIRGDRWELNETETALIGQHTGKAMRLGDPVQVQVDRVDAPRGRVDLYQHA